MVSFTDAHRVPGGILRFLFDKVIKLEKDASKLNFALSDPIHLEQTETAKTDKWEHKMGVKPELAFVSPLQITVADGFSFEITSIDNKYVYYKYTSKGVAESENIVRIVAMDFNGD